ncbi:prolipoprotein diacylglyceryl transferase [Chitinophaga nivalis]|uniref:Prolipoprotein diacylglyceryl transferase n=1 Tax=Chitinophaga nivalis TaxID=2991709 RepID=A0ABT3IPV7_9BACT|nr:prolipoprotein diacylglyceryl transferase family protein [Chitinophaga nivalis]MCW3464326.1 prolipoprotein diacylglyceryl transferase [Chitinophaga nivalis]MCW3485983.1 prolipoprotein diacylglyceryl transferase [Chitinophaga nivalis]
MYPNLYYAVRDLLGIEFPLLKVFQTFGFFVAIAFLAAAYVLTLELKRHEKNGLLKGIPEKFTIGLPASQGEIIGNAVVGFLLGYKILGLFLQWSVASQDLQGFVFSSQGSWWAGIALAAFMGWNKYYTKKKQALPKPQEKEIMVMPHNRVPDIIVMAAVAGLLGAKVFHNLENWNDFIQDPIGALLSFSGLTFYGGLIVAAIVIITYARKKKVNVRALIDSAAPALMLAYGIGRMGCHFSGDGDWGIYNSAYGIDSTGHTVKVAPAAFNDLVQQHAGFFQQQYGDIAHIPHAPFEKPASMGFLPDWFFAYGYPHNVINEGVKMVGCEGQYCKVLPVSVYPTALYEIIACIGLFLVLWAIRKKITVPGVLFGVYLILNGTERFFIEKIRVNTKYDIFGFRPTQAEIIATLMVIGGIVLIGYCRKKYKVESTLS